MNKNTATNSTLKPARKQAYASTLQAARAYTDEAISQNLVRLNIIRIIVLCSQWCTFLYARHQLQLTLHPAVYITLIIFTLISLLGLWRPRWHHSITEVEFFLHLLLDISILTILLYFSGGATNPFISYFLVPICISAAVLPWLYTWTITASCLLLYSMMLYFYIPVPVIELHGQHLNNGLFNFHITGMWLNFTASAILITYFVVKMAAAIRTQEQRLNAAYEEQRRHEQLLAVAALAAGTAHELGTPLSTMAILLNELQHEHRGNAILNSDIILLQQQLTACKKILQKLRDTAEKHQTAAPSQASINLYIQRIITQWHALRPGTVVLFKTLRLSAPPQASISPLLDQAIGNLLSNAADAGSETIEIELDWNETNFILHIKDRGAGIKPEVLQKIGNPFIGEKGLGLGLFLTQITVNRLGGILRLQPRANGGTHVQIELALA